MSQLLDIDVAFDFRSDTPGRKDPDTFSPTLCRYHKLLWGKPLPSGTPFELEETGPPLYLHHRSSLGEFYLASDSAIPTFLRYQKLAHVLAAIPEAQRAEFLRLTYTIGGMIVFPAVRVERKMTINGARGFQPRIRDRFDLTLECIRRYYRDEDSPLRETIARYGAFFRLFDDFRGYVEHFLLQDLVTDDFAAVRFFTPFDDFRTSPVPLSLDAYLSYRRLAAEFILERGRRIQAWRNIAR